MIKHFDAGKESIHINVNDGAEPRAHDLRPIADLQPGDKSNKDLRTAHGLKTKVMERGILCSVVTVLLHAVACSSAPKTIPLAQTRALAAANPGLVALEQQIATKKAEQDALEQRQSELAEKSAQAPKDENLKRQLERLEKENALCQAELASLIGRHQLESARLLQLPDLAEREKIVTKLDDSVKERRAALQRGK
ncbi:MAG: hypothetical protein OHK0011_13590 [Turneriella sp.]